MNEVIKIGLVEDQHLFREGMKAILSTWPDFEVTFEACDGYSVLNSLANSDGVPNVMLVDFSLPSDGNREFSGIDVTDALLQTYPEMKVVILSVHKDENFIAELIQHGAHGYLIKDSDPEEVAEAIRAVYHRGSYINQQTLLAIQNKMANVKKSKTANTLSESLTKREVEVLELVCEQLTAEEIGERLFISVKTVNGHRNNLLRKTHSRNVAGLVLYAVKNELVNLK